jgi:hypothetical protein
MAEASGRSRTGSMLLVGGGKVPVDEPGLSGRLKGLPYRWRKLPPFLLKKIVDNVYLFGSLTALNKE